MSRPQTDKVILIILIAAWLNLLDKHMTAGKINRKAGCVVRGGGWVVGWLGWVVGCGWGWFLVVSHLHLPHHLPHLPPTHSPPTSLAQVHSIFLSFPSLFVVVPRLDHFSVAWLPNDPQVFLLPFVCRFSSPLSRLFLPLSGLVPSHD